MQLTLTSRHTKIVEFTRVGINPKVFGLSSTHPVILPSFASARIDNATPNIITLTYNAPLDELYDPDTSYYSVTANYVMETNVVGSTVVLTCLLSYAYGQVVAVSYYPLPDAQRLLGANGLYAAGFIDKHVANNILPTTVTVDSTIITVDSGTITSDRI